MDANLITRTDIESIYPTTPKDPLAGLKYIIKTIHPKVRAAFPPGSQSSFLECSNYDTVYITSDIHSDLRKFMQILMSLELIPNRRYDSIYDPTLISDVRWTGGERTLFIIVGDLVDGKRDEDRSVDDRNGTFELLLFLLLHNLRIQARKVGSDIRYTMGNHELDSCVAIQEEFYDAYVTDQVKWYFGSPQNRNRILMPFLQASPSILLALAHKGKNELICIHGGLHEDKDTGKRGTDLTKHLIETQTILDRAADLKTFMGTVTTNIVENGELSRGAWTRLYSEDDPGVCTILGKSAYPFTVVGHCPTINTRRTLNIFKKNPAYSHCDQGEDEGHTGCIITDCNKDGAPTLAMVDTGMSAGFRARDPAQNPYREVEVLKLTHNSDLESRTRYYNTIEATKGKGAKDTRTMYKSRNENAKGKGAKDTRTMYKSRNENENAKANEVRSGNNTNTMYKPSTSLAVVNSGPSATFPNSPAVFSEFHPPVGRSVRAPPPPDKPLKSPAVFSEFHPPPNKPTGQQLQNKRKKEQGVYNAAGNDPIPPVLTLQKTPSLTSPNTSDPVSPSNIVSGAQIKAAQYVPPLPASPPPSGNFTFNTKGGGRSTRRPKKRSKRTRKRRRYTLNHPQGVQ